MPADVRRLTNGRMPLGPRRPRPTRRTAPSSSATVRSGEPSPACYARTASRPPSSTLNIDTIQTLHREGDTAIYGDAAHRDTLVSAGVPDSRAVVLSVAGLAGAPDIIRECRELNPSIPILARTAYMRETQGLKAAGATQVFSGEAEVALAFTEAILGRLGATAEQIDRERERVHRDLAAEPA